MTLAQNVDGSVRKGDLVDQALFAQEQDLAVRIAQVHAQERQEKSTPQLRGVDGTVFCKDCGDGISAKRLEAKPHALRCKDCQEAVETRQRN